MAMEETKGRYGLFVLKKKSSSGNKPVIGVNRAFQEENDTSDVDNIKEEKKTVSALKSSTFESNKSKFLKSEVQKSIEKALEEDPTVFDYDNVYDTMKSGGADSKTKDSGTYSSSPKKAKYISNLMQAAEVRKREQERRKEKAIQKERNKESDEFNDKESFVTGAYKEKLALMKEEEELEQKRKTLEERYDVSKQADLSLFYRNLLNPVASKSADVGETTTMKSSTVERSDTRTAQPGSSESDKVKKELSPKPSTQTSAGRDPHVSKISEARSKHIKEDHKNLSEATAKHKEDHKNLSEATAKHKEDHKNDSSKDSGGVISKPKISEKERFSKNKIRDDVEADARAERRDRDSHTNVEQSKQDQSKQTDQVPKFSKRTVGDSLASAREKYLKRKQMDN